MVWHRCSAFHSQLVELDCWNNRLVSHEESSDLWQEKLDSVQLWIFVFSLKQTYEISWKLNCLCACFAFITKTILLSSAGTHEWPISRRWSSERHLRGTWLQINPELASCWWLTALLSIIHLGLGVWRSGDHLFGHRAEVAPSSNIHRPSGLPIHSQNTQSPTKHTQIRIFSQSLLFLCLVNWYIWVCSGGLCATLAVVNFFKCGPARQTQKNRQRYTFLAATRNAALLVSKTFWRNENLHMWTFLHQRSPAAVETPIELMT